MKLRFTLVLAVIGSPIASIAPAAARSEQASLAEVRAATARFHDVDAAFAEGRVFLDCFELEGVGGMGQHVVDVSALDGAVDPLRPEALVYEVREDRLALVAVEYVIPQVAWTATEPPSLFGQGFHRNDALGIWALHAWIWRPNPLGMFVDFNPAVGACP